MTFYESRKNEIDRTAATVSEAFRDLPETQGVTLCLASTAAFLKTETDRLLDLPVAAAECVL